MVIVIGGTPGSRLPSAIPSTSARKPLEGRSGTRYTGAHERYTGSATTCVPEPRRTDVVRSKVGGGIECTIRAARDSGTKARKARAGYVLVRCLSCALSRRDRQTTAARQRVRRYPMVSAA